MPVFARADVMSVAIPVESGGCGQTHSRPVHQGAPVQVWKLVCPRCETPIRKDIESSTVSWTDKEGKKRTVNTSTWGDHEFRIPQTPDEASLTMDMEHEAQKQMAATMQGLAAEVMSKHQVQRVTQIDESVKADMMQAAHSHIAELQAQIRELQQLVQGQQNVQAMAEVAAEAFVPAQPAAGKCPACGGPSVRRNRKGPTPRCEACRANGKSHS